MTSKWLKGLALVSSLALASCYVAYATWRYSAANESRRLRASPSVSGSRSDGLEQLHQVEHRQDMIEVGTKSGVIDFSDLAKPGWSVEKNGVVTVQSGLGKEPQSVNEPGTSDPNRPPAPVFFGAGTKSLVIEPPAEVLTQPTPAAAQQAQPGPSVSNAPSKKSKR